MRIFPGAFINFDLRSISAPLERYAPSIEVLLRWEGESARLDLLIDTGAEVSVLYPKQAEELLGSHLEQIARTGNIGREYVGGLEGPLKRAFRLPVGMTFFDEDGVPFQLDSSILIAEQHTDSSDDLDDDSGNWDNPSLLGRDLLLHFDLRVSGARGEVFLSLPD